MYAIPLQPKVKQAVVNVVKGFGEVHRDHIHILLIVYKKDVDNN